MAWMPYYIRLVFVGSVFVLTQSNPNATQFFVATFILGMGDVILRPRVMLACEGIHLSWDEIKKVIHKKVWAFDFFDCLYRRCLLLHPVDKEKASFI